MKPELSNTSANHKTHWIIGAKAHKMAQECIEDVASILLFAPIDAEDSQITPTKLIFP